MAGDGFEADAVLRYKSDPYYISKCKAKIGLDKGVHYTPAPQQRMRTEYGDMISEFVTGIW
jgi:hypothetical protein